MARSEKDPRDDLYVMEVADFGAEAVARWDRICSVVFGDDDDQGDELVDGLEH